LMESQILDCPSFYPVHASQNRSVIHVMDFNAS